MSGGIIEIDLHGMNCEQAKKEINAQVAKAASNVYRIRLIHGYRGGTQLRNMIKEEYSFGRNPKIKRMEQGWNPGITELVIREL